MLIFHEMKVHCHHHARHVNDMASGVRLACYFQCPETVKPSLVATSGSPAASLLFWLSDRQRNYLAFLRGNPAEIPSPSSTLLHLLRSSSHRPLSRRGP